MSMLFKYGHKKGAAFSSGSINSIPFKGRHVQKKLNKIMSNQTQKKIVNN